MCLAQWACSIAYCAQCFQRSKGCYAFSIHLLYRFRADLQLKNYLIRYYFIILTTNTFIYNSLYLFCNLFSSNFLLFFTTFLWFFHSFTKYF